MVVFFNSWKYILKILKYILLEKVVIKNKLLSIIHHLSFFEYNKNHLAWCD